MARDSSFIPIQIRLVSDESTGGNPKKFRRDSSTLSNKSEHVRAERRSSLMSLFSKAEKSDAESTPNFQDKKHLELFKSGEFQAYLKEHNVLTTAGLQVIFQQFLHDRNIAESERRKNTNERVGADEPVHRRKSSGDSLLSIAGRCTTPAYKRRSTSNGSEQYGSENSLDESIWSIDDSYRRDYMSVIRGDTESLFQQPKEVNEIVQEVNDDVEEESMLKSFFRRSSGVMLGSIDTSNHNRRDSLFSSIGSRGLASSLRSELQSLPSDNVAHARQSPQIGEGLYKIEQGVRATEDSSVCLEDLLGDAQTEDDKSNNGEVEFFFPSRRQSMSFDAPPRRSSLVSRRASESSTQLEKCLNEINNTLLGDDDQTVASGSGNDDSVGTISSFASDEAILCKSSNVQDFNDTFHLRPKFVELHYRPQKQKLSPPPRSHKSGGNLAICGRQLQEHFLASTEESLLVEWGEASR